MRSMQWQLGMLGTISAFAYRHRETKRNLCQGGWSQDLPNTDFQPAVRHLKLKQQYTHSTTNTHKMTTIHTRQLQQFTRPTNNNLVCNNYASCILYCIIPLPQIFQCVRVTHIYVFQHEALIQNSLLLLIVSFVLCYKILNMFLHNILLCCYSANGWQDLWQVLHLCSASCGRSKCNISGITQFEQ